MKTLFTLLAMLTLTGCPLERTNPEYLGSAFRAQGGPPQTREPDAPPAVELPDPDEEPEIPPETCEGPECEPEVVPEDLVPEAHPACVAHESFPDGVSVGELSFVVSRQDGAAFHAEFWVSDEADCLDYTLGEIDRIEVPERGMVLEPDSLYHFDPSTGEGTWTGTSVNEAPFIYWFVYVPVITRDGGEQVAEVEIVLRF